MTNYFYTIEIIRNEQKEIVGRKCLMRSFSPIKIRGKETVAVPSEELFEPEYVVATPGENGKLVLSEDTNKKNLEADIALRMKRIQFGHRLVSIMSIRNESKNLTQNQIVQLVQDFADINTAWLNGSIATSRALVNAITPDGTILTNDDKTTILNEIDSNWQSLGYE